MTLNWMLAMIALFFIPLNLFGVMLYLFEDYLLSINIAFIRPIITAVFWPVYFAALSIYIVQKSNLHIFVPRILMLILAIIVAIHTVHMMYLKIGNFWYIVLRIDKTTDTVSQMIAFLMAGISLLNLTLFYFLGSFILNRFVGKL